LNCTLLTLGAGANSFETGSIYSVLSGYWQNGALNAGFLVLFAIPLWAIRCG
jgi:hypothetical protein